MKGTGPQIGGNVVLSASIGKVDFDSIHLRSGLSAELVYEFLVFDTKTYMQSSQVFFGHVYPSLDSVLMLLGSNTGAGTVLGPFSTVCAATTVPPRYPMKSQDKFAAGNQVYVAARYP